MVTFNLLPWREELQSRRIRQRKQWVGGILGLCFSFFTALHIIFACQIDTLQKEHHQLETALRETEITRLPEKEQLSVKLVAFQRKLVADLMLFRSLERYPQTGICLEEIRRQGQEMHLLGKARRVQDFLSYFQEGEIFSHMGSSKIMQLQKEKHFFKFHLAITTIADAIDHAAH